MLCSDPACREELKVQLTKLEVELDAKVRELDKALVLARELVDRDRLQHSDDFTRKFEKISAELEPIKKMCYIGIGIMLVINVIVYVVLR